jgi:hypothetical protein
MTITITWDWFSFIAGIFAAVVFMFLLLVVLAYRQWSAKRAATKTAMDSWSNLSADWEKYSKDWAEAKRKKEKDDSADK